MLTSTLLSLFESDPDRPDAHTGESKPKPLGALQPVAATYQACVQRLVDELNLTPEEQEKLLPGMLAELEQRLPQILMVLAVTSLLPILGERSRKHFRFKGESADDAEDLAQEVVTKILKAFYGTWPRGNIGAWVSTIRSNVYFDRLRGKEKDEKIMARAKDERRAAGF